MGSCSEDSRRDTPHSWRTDVEAGARTGQHPSEPGLPLPTYPSHPKPRTLCCPSHGPLAWATGAG